MAVEAGGGGVDVEHHHHHHTGHKWLDVVLAVSAVLISMISLFLAIQHGRVMEKMVEADTWAYVVAGITAVSVDQDLTKYTLHPRLTIRNKGVGPAKIDSLEVFYQGTAQPGEQALIRALLRSTDEKRHFRFYESDIVGEVLAAKEELSFVDFGTDLYTPEEYQTIREAMRKLDFRVCYCSVLDECAIFDSREPMRRRQLPVKSCPVPAVSLQHP
jgi:hypothetical protein